MYDKERKMRLRIKDRRRYPRVHRRLALDISARDMIMSSETKNICCSGAYCVLDRPIAPMSRVRLTLLVPVTHKTGVTTEKIDCHGIVLRCDPPGEDDPPLTANAAIIFCNIGRHARCLISKYMKHQLRTLDKAHFM